MKKLYIKPISEAVSINLISSVLDDPQPGMGNYSYTADKGDAKSNGDVVEEDDDLSFNGISSSEISYDSRWSEE